MANPAGALVTKPSAPEFTVTFVEPSPLNPNDGKLIITIKNQPFTPQTAKDNYSGDNWTTYLYYQIRSKPHSSQNWTEYYRYDDLLVAQKTNTNSTYTVLSFDWDGNFISASTGICFPNNTQIDIQVQAINGYIHRIPGPAFSPWEIFGETSDWSNQTLTTPTVTLNTVSPTPVTPEFSSWTILLILSIMVATAGLLVYFKGKGSRTP
jgi:hypothetical protein